MHLGLLSVDPPHSPHHEELETPLAEAQITVIPGVLKVMLQQSEVESLVNRFSRRPLYGGPCLLIDRYSGLALDATPDPSPPPGQGTRPVLWTVHGLPWQQWRIEPMPGGLARIRSAHSGLVLTTDEMAGNRSWVWLDKKRDLPNQAWRLEPTEDRAAFVVETARSSHSLDATTDLQVPACGPTRSVAAPTHPILWQTHFEAQQQWVIARLPLRQPQ